MIVPEPLETPTFSRLNGCLFGSSPPRGRGPSSREECLCPQFSVPETGLRKGHTCHQQVFRVHLAAETHGVASVRGGSALTGRPWCRGGEGSLRPCMDRSSSRAGPQGCRAREAPRLCSARLGPHLGVQAGTSPGGRAQPSLRRGAHLWGVFVRDCSLFLPVAGEDD